MRIFFLFILFFCLNLSVQAQTTFSKLYWNYPYTTFGSSVAVNDSNIFVVGRGTSNIDGFLSPNRFFLKCDLNGNVLLINRILGDEFNLWFGGYASGLEFSNLDELVVAGFKAKYDTLFPPFNEEHNGLIYIYNLNGDTIFTKRIIGDGYTEFARLIFNEETNKVYVGGLTEDTLPSPAKHYLTALNGDCNIIWEFKENDEYHREIGGLIDFIDEDHIISGGIVFNDGADNLGNGKIYKIDASGNAYFSKVIGTTGYDSEIEVKVAKNKKSYIVRQYIDTVINIGDDAYVSYIGKMDTSGNFIWRTFLNDIYFKYFYTLRTFDDGSIVAVGHKVVNDVAITNGYIIKLDSNGTILWQRDYTEYPTSEHYFYDFRQMPDKGFVISGLGVQFIDGEVQSMLWLVRLDSMGCLIPGCDDTPIINQPNIENTIFTIYPNPITNTSTVEIKIPENFHIIPGEKLFLNIYDINGKLVDNYSNIFLQNPNEVIRFNIYKKNVASGIYETVLYYGGMKLGAVKLQYSN